MYALAHEFLVWVHGPGAYLYIALMLVGGFSGTSAGDPIPVLEGCTLGLLVGVLLEHATTLPPMLQAAVAAGVLCWTATFIGMQLRYLVAPPGFHFRAWSPIQIWQRG
jgi:hypothetical protein